MMIDYLKKGNRKTYKDIRKIQKKKQFYSERLKLLPLNQNSICKSHPQNQFILLQPFLAANEQTPRSV